MEMTLTQLTYFAEVARTGSLTAAARELRVSQPTVSEQIRRLERSLGVDLFVRVGRGVRLTDSGRVFLAPATKVLDSARIAESSVTALAELSLGSVSVGLFDQAYICNLSDVIFEFHDRYPGVRQKIVQGNSSEIADQIREGRLEAGVVCLPIESNGLVVKPFLQEPIQYVSRDPSRTLVPKTVEDLTRAELILYDAAWSATDPTRRHLDQAAQRLGLTIEPILDIEDVGTALELVRRGVGDTIVSARILRNFGTQDLHAVELVDPMMEEFAVVHRAEIRLSAANRHFLHLFTEYMTRRMPS